MHPTEQDLTETVASSRPDPAGSIVRTDAPAVARTLRLSTEDVPPRTRREWLREVIGREYAMVDITPPASGPLFNEMLITQWRDLQLSAIRSNAIELNRLKKDALVSGQDAYFAVVLLSGEYSLEQNGRETFLRPGDMALYDATRPHRVRCPQPFSKLIVSIPRTLLRGRIAGVDHCTALRIPGCAGIGVIASSFVRSASSQTATLSAREFSALSEPCLDLLALAITSVHPKGTQGPRTRSASRVKVKDFVERRLTDPALDTTTIASAVGLSSRYINGLFEAEGTSLMRYVLTRRLECCRRAMLAPTQESRKLADIALYWGFRDVAHFSRAFKLRFGCSPRAYREARLPRN
jgi:AraC family transcriptional regulator, positive regulator of tynA and feaB